MKIKWNWGTGLFIGASLFILMIAVFAYFMFRQNFDLVEKDYYPKALVYQERIDKLNNTARLEEKVRVELIGDSVSIHFPSVFVPDSITGFIKFYRPSGVSGDADVPVQLNASGTMFYPISGLIKGNYIVKIDFYHRNLGYYQEETLFVP
jgi:hypothetical protein